MTVETLTPSTNPISKPIQIVTPQKTYVSFETAFAGLKLELQVFWLTTQSSLQVTFSLRTPCCGDGFVEPYEEECCGGDFGAGAEDSSKESGAMECGFCEQPYPHLSIDSFKQDWGVFRDGSWGDENGWQFTLWEEQSEIAGLAQNFNSTFASWAENYSLAPDPLEMVITMVDLNAWVIESVKQVAAIEPTIPFGPLELLTQR